MWKWFLQHLVFLEGNRSIQRGSNNAYLPGNVHQDALYQAQVFLPTYKDLFTDLISHHARQVQLALVVVLACLVEVSLVRLVIVHLDGFKVWDNVRPS